jgi:hypothetical protein
MSKKKARIRAMAPTTPTNIWNKLSDEVTDFIANWRSSNTV